MSSDWQSKTGALEDYEDFPLYSPEHVRAFRVGLGVLSTAFVAYGLFISLTQARSYYMLCLILAMGAILYSQVMSRTKDIPIRFTLSGIQPKGGALYGWHRVSRLQRVPARVWLAPQQQETLIVTISSETMQPPVAVSSIIDTIRSHDDSQSRTLRFTNTPEVIDQIIGAMEKYSERDIRSLVRERIV